MSYFLCSGFHRETFFSAPQLLQNWPNCISFAFLSFRSSNPDTIFDFMKARTLDLRTDLTVKMAKMRVKKHRIGNAICLEGIYHDYRITIDTHVLKSYSSL